MVLDMVDFDVILRMDWLVAYHTLINYFNKVKFQMLEHLKFVFKRGRPRSSPSLISALDAQKLLKKGYEGFLAVMLDVQQPGRELDGISMVREFPDVFPDNLLGMPLMGEIDFTINLMPRTGPVSKAPYQMAPVELE